MILLLIVDRWQRYLFWGLMIAAPLNVGKHFISPNSYVNGILVDYLTPTIYLSDIIIVLFIAFSIAGRIIRKERLADLPAFLLVLPLILLLPSIIVAENRGASIYKFIRFLELSALAAFLPDVLDDKNIRMSVRFILISVIFESSLAITQWLKQGYIFGYLPFGEPLIAPRPPFALTGFFSYLTLRSYGTFPHPNILGGYLAVLLPPLFYLLLYRSSTTKSTLSVLSAVILGMAALFLTFSRSAWFTFAFALSLMPCLLGIPQEKSRRRATLFITGVIVLAATALFLKMEPALSLIRRRELNEAALSMFIKNPLGGVGLNNFTLRLEDLRFVSGYSRFIQPVHNIYLLILSESGLIGFLGFLFLPLVVVRVRKKLLGSTAGRLLVITVLEIFTLGIFDHYLLTIQQGLLIFFIVVGFVLTLLKRKNFPRMEDNAS